MNAQQQGDLTDYQYIPQYVSSGAGGTVLSKKSQVDWIVKLHGDELVKQGVLIRGRGRRGSLVHIRKFGPAVLAIIARERA